MLKLIFVVGFCIIFVKSHPTMYRMNDKHVLEPDLVPVSSTVIPLPVYKVSYGIDVISQYKDQNMKKPDGPIKLQTVYTKKKHIPVPKSKPLLDVSKIKQVSQEEYEN